jgi:hypothetical protein
VKGDGVADYKSAGRSEAFDIMAEDAGYGEMLS